ncbi:carbohydrate ABC transporter permease [Paenibacillus sp. GD4]|jgi:raffinose/stachyose/melibiose transport system permease protein|uniref:carbohydrate ABC transporter permease n=1 Tax=Paenibacillus sp. GD4 TaxID=3068890 RepID=UPI002796ABC4|nr:carbohydrate ABC transporter permease [Paenibacillus sp. GD4]MDQ1912703.1 carbohydrate ABC transporter permease [Paenibacillus sp. GD4]
MNAIAQASKEKAYKRTLRPARLLSTIVLWLFLLTVLAFTVFPILMAILGSLKTNLDLTTGATFWPKEWRFDNYVKAWKSANFAKFTWNSFFVGTLTTVGTIAVASMAAYAVDRVPFRGKRFYVVLQSCTLFVSIGAVVLRPQFDLMISLNLQKSLLGVVILLVSAHATAFFMLIGFFKAIPKELDEAALIDGCNFYTVYLRIILPLLTPAIGVTALFTFRNAWNEYILPLVFTMTQPDLQTLTVGLASLRYGMGEASEQQLMLAGACISLLPILLVYVFANKSFMQVTAGSVKG